MGRTLVWALIGLLLVPIVQGSKEELPIAPAVETRDVVNPLRADNVNVWLPVFLATQDMQAAIAAAEGQTVNYYDLQPLGDANRDGAADFLLASRIHILENRTEDFGANPDVTTVHAISGADGTALWSRGLSAEQSWFMLGDVDVDGVNDLTIRQFNSTSTGSSVSAPVAGQSRSQSTYRTDVEIVNGRTGSVMFARSGTGYFNTEVTYASGPALIIQKINFTSTNEGPSALAPGIPGVDWTRSQSNLSIVLALVGVGFTQVYENMFSPVIERLDPAGATQWKIGPAASGSTVVIAARQDVTGDGIPDYVAAARSAKSISTLAGSMPITTDARLARITAYDGKTGGAIWTYDVPATEHDPTRTFVSAAYGGKAGGAGSVLVSLAGPLLAKPDEYATTLRFLDGSNGEVQASKTYAGRYVIAAPAGDIDGDGSDELLASSIPRSANVGPAVGTVILVGNSELSLLNRDFSPAWSVPDIPFRSPSLMLQPDLDGDAVPDVFVITNDENNVTTTVLRTKDGSMLWNHTADRRVENMGVVPSVDGRFGGELGITELEVPHNELPNDAGSPFGSDFNYADYGARLSLRRGNDNALVWSAAVREPSKSGETLVSPFPRLQNAGDVNQDGVPDLLYTLRSTLSIRITCSDTCIIRIIGDDELLVNVAMVLSGADGSLLYSYPDRPGELRVQRGPIQIPATPKIRANQADGDVPGASLAVVVTAVAAAAAAISRKR